MGYVQPYLSGNTLGVSKYAGPSADGGSWRPFPQPTTAISEVFSREPILSRPAMALTPGYDWLHVALLYSVGNFTSEMLVLQYTCDGPEAVRPGNVCW
jgi:hypothetical protein